MNTKLRRLLRVSIHSLAGAAVIGAAGFAAPAVANTLSDYDSITAPLTVAQGLGFQTNAIGANSLASSLTWTYTNTIDAGPNVTGTTDTFFDDYVFTIASSNIDSWTASLNLGSLVGLSNLRVRLFNVAGNTNGAGTLDVVTGAPAGGSLLDSWSTPVSGGTGSYVIFNPAVLARGTYDLQVEADVSGIVSGTYVGQLNASPVPLPAALPLLLSGLGLVGGAAVGKRHRADARLGLRPDRSSRYIYDADALGS